MRRLFPRILVFTLIVLLISAFTVCPAAAALTPPISYTPLASPYQGNCVFNEQDTLYAFTAGGLSGVIHERDGKIQTITIGSTQAQILEDTQDKTIVLSKNPEYQITIEYTKPTRGIVIYKNTGSKSSPDVVHHSQYDLTPILTALERNAADTAVQPVQQTALNKLNSYLGSFVSIDTMKTCIQAGVLLTIASTCPPPIAIPLISAYFIGSAKAVVQFVAIPLVDAGAIALIVAGVTVGYVSIATLQKACTGDTSGDRYFVVEKNSHYYKFKYNINTGKDQAEYITEVSVVEGVFVNLGDSVIEFNGSVLKGVKDFQKAIDNIFATITQQNKKGAQYTYYLLDGKYKSRGELNSTKALELASKCTPKPKDGPAWIGSTKEGCEFLAIEATKAITGGKKTEPIAHTKANGKAKTGQPDHYHPSDWNGNPCKPHLFWDYENVRTDL